jgi:hypothetical protein
MTRLTTPMIALCLLLLLGAGPALAEEAEETSGSLGGQSAESAANDATASLWTYQLAWEGRTWRDDIGPTGEPRPEGNRSMLQFRMVAPMKLTKSLKLLNRLTLRNNEAVDRSSGAGDAEYFAMFIPIEWATGRWGIGPQINIPGEDDKFGSTVWRYGFATGLLQRAAQDKILWGVLVQQVWGKTDPNNENDIVAQPITLQPVFNYSLPGKYYLNIGETAASYDWQAKAWLVPLGIRFGKLWIKESGATWNLYAEYRTAVIYDDWPGSALDSALRINLSYAMPM